MPRALRAPAPPGGGVYILPDAAPRLRLRCPPLQQDDSSAARRTCTSASSRHGRCRRRLCCRRCCIAPTRSTAAHANNGVLVCVADCCLASAGAGGSKLQGRGKSEEEQFQAAGCSCSRTCPPFHSLSHLPRFAPLSVGRRSRPHTKERQPSPALKDRRSPDGRRFPNSHKLRCALGTGHKADAGLPSDNRRSSVVVWTL